MTRPGHVHLRLTAANLDGLDRWAKAHDLTRNEAANQLFERYLGGLEVGQIQRAVVLAELIAQNLHKLHDAHRTAATDARFAHIQLLQRLTSIELISTEALFLLRSSISSVDPATYKEVETSMRSVTGELRRQLRHDMRQLRLSESSPVDNDEEKDATEEEEDE